MKKDNVNDLSEQASRYVLTTRQLNTFLEDLKDLIQLNFKLIINSNKEDVKIYKKQINIEEFINIIDSYKNSECILEEDERKLVLYKGDPYLTLHICIQSLIKRIKVILIHDEFMLGVNEVILAIFNEALKEHNIFNLINSENDYSIKKIKEIEKLVDGIVVIGDTSLYQGLDIEKNIKFYPYNNIMLYCESEELEELQEAMYIYANENQYEMEILYEENLQDAINIINSDEFVNIAILLTKSDESKINFETLVKNKKVYINSNPFKQEVNGKVYNYLV